MTRLTYEQMREIRRFISDCRYDEYGNVDYTNEFNKESYLVDGYYDLNIKFDKVWLTVTVTHNGIQNDMKMPNRYAESELVDTLYKLIDVMIFSFNA